MGAQAPESDSGYGSVALVAPLPTKETTFARGTFVDRDVAPSPSPRYWLNGLGTGLMVAGARGFAAVGAAEALSTNTLERCPADRAGITPRLARVTRLAQLISSMDPKLVAAAFGLNSQGVLDYLADHVDEARLPAPARN